MQLWTVIVGSLMILMLLVFCSMAIVFNYQRINCIGDKRVLCWADWYCPNDGTPPGIFVLREYFLPYANKCLFGATCDCDGLGYQDTLDNKPGYANNIDVYGAPQPSGFGIYSNDNQNMCGSNYPPGLIT